LLYRAIFYGGFGMSITKAQLGFLTLEMYDRGLDFPGMQTKKSGSLRILAIPTD
jgi:hypothetical protein